MIKVKSKKSKKQKSKIAKLKNEKKSRKWTTFNLGCKKERSLPDLAFNDPDYFFWAYKVDAFSTAGVPKDEIKEAYNKATNIRILSDTGEKMYAYYSMIEWQHRFKELRIAPKFASWIKLYKDKTIMESVINLEYPSMLMKKDKSGYRKMKTVVFDNLFDRNYRRMPKQLCEEFFSNDKNFKFLKRAFKYNFKTK